MKNDCFIEVSEFYANFISCVIPFFIYVVIRDLKFPEQITLSDETPIEIHEPIRVSVDPWEEVDTEADAIGDALKEQVRKLMILPNLEWKEIEEEMGK